MFVAGTQPGRDDARRSARRACSAMKNGPGAGRVRQRRRHAYSEPGVLAGRPRARREDTRRPSTAAQPYTLTRLARFDWPSAAGPQRADRHARSRCRQLHDRAPTARRCCSTRRTRDSRSSTGCPLAGGAPGAALRREGRQLRLARGGAAARSSRPTSRARSRPEIVRVDRRRRHAHAPDRREPRRARRARSAEARALLVHREERQADPQRDLLPAAARSLAEVSAARDAARRPERDGQRQFLDALERAPADVARLRAGADQLHRIDRLRREVRRRHRARRAARAGARSPRRRAGSDQALSRSSTRRGRPRSAPATAAT